MDWRRREKTPRRPSCNARTKDEGRSAPDESRHTEEMRLGRLVLLFVAMSDRREHPGKGRRPDGTLSNPSHAAVLLIFRYARQFDSPWLSHDRRHKSCPITTVTALTHYLSKAWKCKILRSPDERNTDARSLLQTARSGLRKRGAFAHSLRQLRDQTRHASTECTWRLPAARRRTSLHQHSPRSSNRDLQELTRFCVSAVERCSAVDFLRAAADLDNQTEPILQKRKWSRVPFGETRESDDAKSI